MMVRVRTPFFTRNPYLLGDTTWGLTYVVHGLAGVGLVGLVIAHVYFAVRPEKWWITKSMLLGWITRRQYLEHHDPERWVAAKRQKAKGARLNGRAECSRDETSSGRRRSVRSSFASGRRAYAAPHDLLIRGGRVIDPSRGFDRIADVAIANGRIAAVGVGIAPEGAKETIDATGKLVVPGPDRRAHARAHARHARHRAVAGRDVARRRRLAGRRQDRRGRGDRQGGTQSRAHPAQPVQGPASDPAPS